MSSLKDTSIVCDYLVIAPEKFINHAKRLAEHRNSFNGDDVTSAKVIDVTKIYEEFKNSDTMKNFDAIHHAILWTYKNWSKAYRYIVLIGDDSIGTQSSNPYQWNRGPIPTYTLGNISV